MPARLLRDRGGRDLLALRRKFLLANAGLLSLRSLPARQLLPPRRLRLQVRSYKPFFYLSFLRARARAVSAPTARASAGSTVPPALSATPEPAASARPAHPAPSPPPQAPPPARRAPVRPTRPFKPPQPASCARRAPRATPAPTARRARTPPA